MSRISENSSCNTEKRSLAETLENHLFFLRLAKEHFTQ